MTSIAPTPTAARPRTRGRILVLVLGVAVAAVCVRLGIWQLHRLDERRAANHAYRLAGALPPLRLSSDVAAGLMRTPEAYALRRVELDGAYLPSPHVVVVGRARGGRPGVHVVSPFRTRSGAIVLVNRGWVPSDDAATVDVPPPLAGAARVEGIVREVPDGRPSDVLGSGTPGVVRVRRVSRAALGKLPVVNPVPVVVERMADGAEEPAGMPLAVEAPALTEGPHLGYAVQWFSFAALAVVGSALLALRRPSRG